MARLILTFAFIGLFGTQISCTQQALSKKDVALVKDKEEKLMIDENENPTKRPEEEIQLSAKVKRDKEDLAVEFEITNESDTDIYLMDVLPLYDLNTMKPTVDLNHSVVIWNEEKNAVRIIRGLPPIPEEQDVTAYITPKATKIESGEKLKRTIKLALPLIEACPYYAPVEVKEDEEYEYAKITSVQLYVDVVRADVEGFEAEPVSMGEGLYHVKTPQLIADTERFKKEFDIPETELLLYPGTFTRRI